MVRKVGRWQNQRSGFQAHRLFRDGALWPGHAVIGDRNHRIAQQGRHRLAAD